MWPKGLTEILSRRNETAETLMEQRVQGYAALLLRDSRGSLAQQAIADRVLPKNAEPGHKIARAVFYEHEGSYVVDEYRDGAATPAFTEYMVPLNGVDVSHPHYGHNWLVGMRKNRWSRLSPEPGYSVRPFLKVLETFFGKLPD